MIPQGSAILNTQQYDAYIERIDSVNSCEALQSTVNDIVSSLNAELAAITDQINKLAPIAALLEAPTTPDEVVEWVSGLITGVLQPLYAPAITYQAQLVARTAKLAEILNSISEKADEFSSCSISIPT